MYIPSTAKETDDDKTHTLLERVASNLTDSIINYAVLFKSLDHDYDKNTDVRELSDDENALRELDENDISGTDEFIVFATKPETSDDNDNNNNNSQTSSTIPRDSLNRLYTFSRTNDGDRINSRKVPSNQVRKTKK